MKPQVEHFEVDVDEWRVDLTNKKKGQVHMNNCVSEKVGAPYSKPWFDWFFWL